MDAKTLKALKASIAKWERNAVAETPYEYLIGSENCPLCKLFNHEYVDTGGCIGCPVMGFTRADYCEFTPYVTAEKAHYAWQAAAYSKRPENRPRNVAHAAARAEVKFLKSLLPKDQSND